MKGLSIAMLLVVLFYTESLEVINICTNNEKYAVQKPKNENHLRVQWIVTKGNSDNAERGCDATINGFTPGDWIALEGVGDCPDVNFDIKIDDINKCVSDEYVEVMNVSERLRIQVPLEGIPRSNNFTIFQVKRVDSRGLLSIDMTGDDELVGGVINHGYPSAESDGASHAIIFRKVAGLTLSFHVMEIGKNNEDIEPSIRIDGTSLPTYPVAVRFTTRSTTVTVNGRISKFFIKYSVIRCSDQLESAELASTGTAAVFNPGNTTTYRCKEGWNHGTASDQTTCEVNKDNVTASFKDISCDEVTCPRMVNGNNTIYHFEPDVYRYTNNDNDNTTTKVVLFNTIADLHCTDDSEYRVNGSLKSVCNGSGEWDPHPSTCIPRPRSTTILVVMIGLALAAAVVVGGILVWMYVTKRSNEVANQSDSREDIDGRSRSPDEIIPYESSQGLAKAYPPSPGPQDSKQGSPGKGDSKGANGIEQESELRPVTPQGAPQRKKEVVYTQITPKHLRKPKVPPKMF